MSERTVDSVIKRLERLEQQNRLLKVVGIAMLVILTAAACEVGQKLEKENFAEVKAGRFVLVGGNNEELATLGIEGLTLHGPAANIILRNVDEKDWPQYLIVDDSWQRFQPNITLLGRNGNIILNVGRSSDKEGPGFGPFVSIDNHPVNNLKGAEEEMVELSLSGGKPRLNVYKDKNVIWSAP